MPISLTDFISQLEPEKTVLLFGSGSSIPSNVPSVPQLQQLFEDKFGQPAQGYSLAEQTAIIEINTNDRKSLIGHLRASIKDKTPTGALLNLPLYNWKSIFTTNYDRLIEMSYDRRARPYAVYTSNFDFGQSREPDAIQIFKLHGTIDKDVVDGDRSRIILTTNDYDLTEEYREDLFTRFSADMLEAHLVIVGHSLADPDIRAVVDRALRIRQSSGGQRKITILSYSRDVGMASLQEKRGLDVCFGGLDDFFAALSRRVAAMPLVTATASEDPLDIVSALRPATLEVAHARDTGRAHVGAMFNGWPASYADILAGLTFPRTVAGKASSTLSKREAQIAVLLGPSGVGKTTAARQVLSKLSTEGLWCWEHKADQVLSAKLWRIVAKHLADNGKRGCLFVDDAHHELFELNELIDYLATDQNDALSLVLSSSKNQWFPRVKTQSFHARAKEFSFNRVSATEIDELLSLLERVPEIKALVETSFAGFTRMERRRRLVERCDADMFVCLKNIFSSEQFDNIVLREYGELGETQRDVYRSVAALESAGVRVHRQLVIRLLGIPAMTIASTLEGLRDIVHEYTVSEREGVYGWRGRHRVIMGIIAEHKYYNAEKRYDLFEKVIDNLSPSYDIEVRSIKELCNVDTGLATIPDREKQNVLLRKMMSVAPRERVPRHRLIRNLIALEQYDAAATEIRVFEKDFKIDGPTARYRIDLSVARATHSKGIMDEDRIAILQKACEAAASTVARFRHHKAVIGAYCEAAIEYLRYTGDHTFFDAAIFELRAAETKLGDRHITQMISRFEAMVAGGGRSIPTIVALEEEADVLD